jgi:hypothetical protein
LFIDGSYLISGVSKAVLEHPAVDAFDNHYYDGDRPPGVVGDDGVRIDPQEWTFGGRIAADAQLVRSYGKVFLAGEFGLVDLSKMKEILDAVQNIPSISGAMVLNDDISRLHTRDIHILIGLVS